MGFSQVVMMLWFLVILLVASNQHGKPLRGRMNFWITSAVVVVHAIVLAYGGFFVV